MITEVTGEVRLDGRSLASDAVWQVLAPATDLAIVFRESRYVKRGARNVTVAGAYRAFVADSQMQGGWFSHARCHSRSSRQ